MGGVTVRAITMADAEAYRLALDAVCREGRYLSRLAAPPPERSRAFVEENLAAGYPHLVALAEGTVVGWCDIRPGGAPFFSHVGTLGMGVLAPWRGQGIGRRLVDEALAAAWTAGFRRVELEVYASNETAIGLYERAGFVLEGRLRDAVRVGDAFTDMLVMAVFAPDQA